MARQNLARKGCWIFAAAAALVVGQRSMKDVFPPRALPQRANLQQRTRSLFVRWVLAPQLPREHRAG